MNTTCVLITGRENSRRLHRKCFINVDGIPALEFIYRRISNSGIFDYGMIATSNSPAIVEYCENNSLNCISLDNENDVLGRFYSVAKSNKFNILIRVTMDDLFFDVELSERLLKEHIAKENDYTYSINHIKGCECEVFKASKLIEVYESLDVDQREKSEYMTWLFRNVKSVKQSFIDEEFPPGFTCELDTMEDLYQRVIPLIHSNAYGSQEEIFEFLKGLK